jgi:hypothetical protein
MVWHDYGDRIIRNSVSEDPRPTMVEAEAYETLTGPEGQLGGLRFFRENDDEPFLVLFDVPIMISRVGA